MTGGKRNLGFAKERFLPSAGSGQAVASLCRNDSCDQIGNYYAFEQATKARQAPDLETTMQQIEALAIK